MKFEDLKVWKRSSRLCADLYKHFQGIKDFARFLQYSKGSCGELRTQIYIGIDIDYIEPAVGKKWIQEIKELSAMLVGLSKSLRKIN
ncbi:MAG TPA: four helix bundle protein [Deltaproteobacteria bacterium]|nr:four helix bundle protein [Deltaproteobacteria bacterium]